MAWMIPVAAIAMKAVGGIQQANAQSAMYSSQSAADQANAEASRQQADLATLQAGSREELKRAQGRKILSAQRTATAQSGVDPNSGSALTAQVQSAGDAEMDALMIRYEGNIQRKGLLDQAAQQDWMASVNRKNASMARSSGLVKTAADVLGTASSFYGMGKGK